MNRALSISIFFPTYNEEDSISSIVQQADIVARQITDAYEIIIVNDGSQDKTRSIADGLARENPHVRVIHHPKNSGYGAAVWSGLQTARHEYVFFTDADLQFDLNELKKLVQYVPDYEAVIGYRSPRRDPWIRLVNAKGWNILNKLLFGLKVRDIDCAFKLFKTELVKDAPVQSRGAMISAELLLYLQNSGIILKEIPVTHLPRTSGTATGAHPKVIFRAFKELLSAYQRRNPMIPQMIKFGAVGVLNTLLDIGAYFLLTRDIGFFDGRIITAKILSFLIGTVSSFILNRYWTFNIRGPVKWAELGRFYLTVGSALFINAAAMYLFTKIVGVNDLVAVLAATILTFAWSFTFSKLWVFTPSEKISSESTRQIHLPELAAQKRK